MESNCLLPAPNKLNQLAYWEFFIFEGNNHLWDFIIQKMMTLRINHRLLANSSKKEAQGPSLPSIQSRFQITLKFMSHFEAAITKAINFLIYCRENSRDLN